MSELIQGLLIISVYRLLTILVGFGVIYFGYRLFVVGVFQNAGDFKAAWGEHHLALKRAAPGTFFALFGAVIVSISMWKGIDSSRGTSVSPEPTTPAQQVDLRGGVERQPPLPSGSPLAEMEGWMDESLMETHPERYDILQKVAQGGELTPPERQAVEQWVTEETIHFSAENTRSSETEMGLGVEEGTV